MRIIRYVQQKSAELKKNSTLPNDKGLVTRV